MSNPYSRKQKGGNFKKNDVPCRDFAKGSCLRGKSCHYSHNSGGSGGGGGKQETNMLLSTLSLVMEKHGPALTGEGFLNLSNFSSYPDLAIISASIDFNAVKFCDALCQAIKHKFPTTSVIAVNNNSIKTLRHFIEALKKVDLHTGIRGLSANNNEIHTLDFLRQLKEFTNLNELVLSDNPVAKQDKYLTIIRKALPDLAGLDGQAVQRPALALPWPRTQQYDETTVGLLQYLESNVFGQLEASGIDAALTTYHPSAMFTLSFDPRFELKPPPGASKEVHREFTQMKLLQKEKNRNILDRASGIRAVKGRAELGAALKSTMYPSWAVVSHKLDGNADVQMMQNGVKVACAVATLHGTISWQAKAPAKDGQTPYPPVQRLFDRTFVIVQDGDGRWVVSNDAVHLRPLAATPVFEPRSDERVAKVARTCNMEQTLVAAAFETSKSDSEVDATLKDLTAVPAHLVQECGTIVDGDVALAINAARAIAHTGLRPSSALELIKAANGNLQGALENWPATRATLGPEHFVQ